MSFCYKVWCPESDEDEPEEPNMGEGRDGIQDVAAAYVRKKVMGGEWDDVTSACIRVTGPSTNGIVYGAVVTVSREPTFRVPGPLVVFERR
jgi:hypothetical protein